MSIHDAIRFARKTVLEHAVTDLEKCATYADEEDARDSGDAIRAMGALLSRHGANGTHPGDMTHHARDLQDRGPRQQRPEGQYMAAKQLEMTARRLAAIDTAEDLVRRAEWLGGPGAERVLWDGAATLLIAGAVASTNGEQVFAASLLQQTAWALPVLENDDLRTARETLSGTLDALAHPVIAGADYD